MDNYSKNLNEIKEAIKNKDSKKLLEIFSSTKKVRKELEDRYKILIDDYNNLSKKLDEFQNQEKIEQKKQIEFSEKIDELNQETDTLLYEIDKWQT